MADVTSEDIQNLTNAIDSHSFFLDQVNQQMISNNQAINDLNSSMIEYFEFDLVLFAQISGSSFVMFVTGFWIGNVIKTMRKA